MCAAGRDHAAGEVNETEKDRGRCQFADDHQRARSITGRHGCDCQKVQRDEQRRDRENAAAGRRQFPTMLGVETDAEEDCSNRREDQKPEHRDLRDLGPEADDECGRTTDDQQTADDLAPADVALFHEGVEHFGKRSARRGRWFNSWWWCFNSRRRWWWCRPRFWNRWTLRLDYDFRNCR